MVSSSSRYAVENPFSLTTFPTYCRLETAEQIRRFELLRLAFFVLKLRKLEQGPGNSTSEQNKEYVLHCSLLRHVIFQQVLTLTVLDARPQAMQLIDTCRK